jgi:hypothetical protein
VFLAKAWKVLALTAAVAASACSSSLPAPPETAHPASAYVEVPYPPPAALVEVVPREAPENSVWVDGYWTWRGRYYVWQRGGWLVPPENAAYATWRTQLTNDGRLMFAPGAWYDAAKAPLTPPRLLVRAQTPANGATPETDAPR